MQNFLIQLEIYWEKFNKNIGYTILFSNLSQLIITFYYIFIMQWS